MIFFSPLTTIRATTQQLDTKQALLPLQILKICWKWPVTIVWCQWYPVLQTLVNICPWVVRVDTPSFALFSPLWPDWHSTQLPLICQARLLPLCHIGCKLYTEKVFAFDQSTFCQTTYNRFQHEIGSLHDWNVFLTTWLHMVHAGNRSIQ